MQPKIDSVPGAFHTQKKPHTIIFHPQFALIAACKHTHTTTTIVKCIARDTELSSPPFVVFWYEKAPITMALTFDTAFIPCEWQLSFKTFTYPNLSQPLPISHSTSRPGDDGFWTLPSVVWWIEWLAGAKTKSERTRTTNTTHRLTFDVAPVLWLWHRPRCIPCGCSWDMQCQRCYHHSTQRRVRRWETRVAGPSWLLLAPSRASFSSGKTAPLTLSYDKSSPGWIFFDGWYCKMRWFWLVHGLPLCELCESL